MNDPDGRNSHRNAALLRLAAEQVAYAPRPWLSREPQLADGQLVEHGEQSAGVVRMWVREHDDVEARHAQLRQGGKDDARSDVGAPRGEAAQIATAVDEHRPASRELYERGVALSDGEERHAQLPGQSRRGGVREARAEQGARGEEGAADSRPRRGP